MESVLCATRGVHGINFEAIRKDGIHVDNPWYHGRLDVDTWLTYCTEMLELVHCLHSQKIVHGDVKLSNFCILPHEPSEPVQLIMIDFGAQFAHCAPTVLAVSGWIVASLWKFNDGQAQIHDMVMRSVHAHNLERCCRICK